MLHSAREGAQAAVVPAGAQLVVVAAGVSLLVVPPEHRGGGSAGAAGGGTAAGSGGGSAGGGGRSGASGGGGVKGRGVRGCMSSSSSSDPSLVKKSPQVFSCHLHVCDRDREYDKKYFYLILFSSKLTRESTYLIINNTRVTEINYITVLLNSYLF